MLDPAREHAVQLVAVEPSLAVPLGSETRGGPGALFPVTCPGHVGRLGSQSGQATLAGSSRRAKGLGVSTYLLLPGAGGAASYWSRVAPMLVDAGHRVVAGDLPGPSAKAGLPEYTDLVVAAAGETPSVVLVAQSLGGFTAAMAAERLLVQELVLVNAMIPVPGETPGRWWEATGAVQAREAAAERGGYGAFDAAKYFRHDVDTLGFEEGQNESEAVFDTRCMFTSWPAAPIRVLAGADDSHSSGYLLTEASPWPARLRVRCSVG